MTSTRPLTQDKGRIIMVIEHAIMDVMRKDASGSVRCLPELHQCVCNKAGNFTEGLCHVIFGQ
jgi:hypothetical protein